MLVVCLQKALKIYALMSVFSVFCRNIKVVFVKCAFIRHSSVIFVKVDDLKALPNYPYRDDALLLHQVLWDYVREVLQAHYGKKQY